MGPYYLTALVYLMGRPVRRVCASGAITFPTRTIGSGEKKGKIIDVEIPTHLCAVLEFEGAAVATVTMSFDVWGSEIPRIEIYGSEGSLSAPDPNGFGGPVRILKGGEPGWTDQELVAPYENNRRGVGLLEMARAIRENRPHRANGEVALHVLEIMEAAHRSMKEGRHIELETRPVVPSAL
jgi:predicted dehydrogenase